MYVPDIERDIGEKCAVFGIFSRGLDVSRLTFFGLHALQHRGQETSGIAVGDGNAIHAHTGVGLVQQVFSNETIESLRGMCAIGHNRYSTSEGSGVAHAQPFVVGGSVALAHNGNLPSTAGLQRFLSGKGVVLSGVSDSRLMAEAVSVFLREGASLPEAVRSAYPLFTGAFSLLVMSEGTLIAVRDGYGVRPLSLGRLGEAPVFASETCAFPPLGAVHERDILPGEMFVVDERGERSERLEEGEEHIDAFEFVYFARPDSSLSGRSVYEVRKRFGQRLAQESRIEADIVVPVPETSIPAALGYSRASGIPLELALVKSRYVHRTFIQPGQEMRERSVSMKLTPLSLSICGKRLIVLDDSIVRGTTSRQIVSMLFQSGAKEVHFLSCSPPVRFPDFYGIDTPEQKKLLAATRTVEEMRAYLGATSLRFLSLAGMVEAIGLPRERLNTSCFTGEYPIDIGERKRDVLWPPFVE